MTYVKLGYDNIIKKSKNRVVIHNLLSSKTFIVSDKDKIMMLEDALENLTLNELQEKYCDKWVEFKKELELKYLIRYSNNNSKFADRWEATSKLVRNQKFSSPVPTINKVYLEISDYCSLNCNNCRNILKEQFSCSVCNKTTSINDIDKLTINDYEYIIKNLKSYNTKELIFTGADPLENIELIQEIINLANLDFKYTIITNGVLLLNSNVLNIIKEYKIQLNIQIVENSAMHLKEIINIISENKLQSIFIIREEINNDLIKILEKNNMLFEYQLNIDNIITNKNYLITNKNLANPVNLASNIIEEDYNMCLYSKALISLGGQVYPCNSLKKLYVGNIKDKNIADIAIKLEEIWKNKSLNNTHCSRCSLIKNCISCLSIKEKYDCKLLCEFY